MNTFFIKLLVIVLLFPIIWSCKTDQTTSTILEKKDYQQELSELIIPVDIDIASFEQLFNEQMEAQEWFYEQDSIEVKKNISLAYKIKKDGQAQLYPQDEKIHLVLPMLIDIHTKVKGPLAIAVGKEIDLQARVAIKSKIEPSIKDNWDLSAATTTTFAISETPQLSVLGFEIDFGKELRESLEVGLDEINEQIEAQIKAAINTEEIVQLVWTQLKEPYNLSEEPFETWANIHPQKIYTTNLLPSGPGKMRVTLVVDALIAMQAGKKPELSKKELPHAIKINKSAEEKSVLNFPLLIDKHALIAYLNQEMAPLEIPIAGADLKLQNFKTKPTTNRVTILADFSYKKVKGILEITGIPEINPDSQVLSLTQIKLKTDSKNAVIDQMVHLAQKNQSIQQKLQENLKYSLQDQLNQLTFDVTKQLKTTTFNDYARLNGYVEKIQLKDVYVRENDLLIDTTVKAGIICLVTNSN